MSDYLDAMIEAYDAERGLWREKIDAFLDIHEIWRGPVLVKRKSGQTSFEEAHAEYMTLLARATMKVAYEAAVQTHFGNPLAVLNKPGHVQWTDMPASAPASVRHIGNIGAGDGVALMSVAHPAPQKTERELLIERIAEATRLAAGG